MSNADIEVSSARAIQTAAGSMNSPWTTLEAGAAYRCCVYLHPEDDGGFSVQSADLPGVISEGDSEEDALKNVVEAFQAVIESHTAHGEAIPWSANAIAMEAGDFRRFVEVNINA